MARKCVFCGGQPLTREHAIPQWVRQYLPGQGRLRHEVRGGSTWEADSLDVKVAKVCKPCNEGWMSRLETRAKPLLAAPIQLQPQTWNRREQRTVAAWAFKTAVMCALVTNESDLPEADLRHLRERLCPPSRVRIWTTALGDAPGETEHRAAWYEAQGLAFHRPGMASFDGYVVTVNVGYFAFQVFGHKSRQKLDVTPPMIQGVSPEGYEARIWPPRPETVSWPTSHGFDRSGLSLYAKRLTA